jgi:quinol monooxygenase YgiN
MIIRIVKMTFKPEHGDTFITLFDRYKSHIRAAAGCTQLSMWRCTDDPRIFFTYSHWESPKFLDAYRHSAIFAEVWPQTKALFEAAPEAWTNEVLFELPS